MLVDELHAAPSSVTIFELTQLGGNSNTRGLASWLVETLTILPGTPRRI
jgi:hypothetical protein